MGRGLFTLGEPKTHLLLVSGILDFLHQYLSVEGVCRVGVTEQFAQAWHLPLLSLRMLQMRHVRCGGATKKSILWTSAGLG